MKIIRRNRKFVVGKLKEITLTDKGSIYLNNNDNITFHYNKKINYDIAKKIGASIHYHRSIRD